MGGTVLRKSINDALASATKAQERRRIATLRLMNAAIKDRDIAVRGSGKDDHVSDQEIQQLLQKMIKQREDSVVIYADAGRTELAEQEREEMAIIREFLPQQMSQEEIRSAVEAIIAETDATCVRDMGKCMGELKARYPGQMDFGKASAIVKSILCNQQPQAAE